MINREPIDLDCRDCSHLAETGRHTARRIVGDRLAVEIALVRLPTALQ
jgi:hypothetical protein